MPDHDGFELDEMARALLETWLQNPKEIADALGIDEKDLKNLSPEELIEYFKSDSRIRPRSITGAANGLEPAEHRRWGTPGIIREGCVWAVCRETGLPSK